MNAHVEIKRTKCTCGVRVHMWTLCTQQTGLRQSQCRFHEHVRCMCRCARACVCVCTYTMNMFFVIAHVCVYIYIIYIRRPRPSQSLGGEAPETPQGATLALASLPLLSCPGIGILYLCFHVLALPPSRGRFMSWPSHHPVGCWLF